MRFDIRMQGDARDGVLRALTPFAAIFVPDAARGGGVRRRVARGDARGGARARDGGGPRGLVPATRPTPIAAACRAERSTTAAQLAREGRAAGNPVEPLVRALRARVGGEPPASSTSARRARTSSTRGDARRAARAAADRRRSSTARRRLRPARGGAPRHGRWPRARCCSRRCRRRSGYKAAGWLVGVVDARARARRASPLPAQLGGAAGTLAALGEQRAGGAARSSRQELGLAEPVLPWHTQPRPVAELGGALAALRPRRCEDRRSTSSCSRRPRSARWPEAEGGGSSTMPHKRNPTRAIARRRLRARTCVRTRPCSRTAVTSTSARPAPGTRSGMRSRRARARRRRRGGDPRCLDGLQVDAERMRANLSRRSSRNASRSRSRRSSARAGAHRRRRDVRRRRPASRARRHLDAAGSTSCSTRRLSRRGRRVRRPRPRALPRMSGTVVLCGSLGSTSAMWDPQLPALDRAAAW